MLKDYWPTEEEIKRCIRTEAEELAEHVLLAVHEPIRLERRRPGSGSGDLVPETDLLAQLLKVDRPIPIIGDSGMGKSHLIRWLDAKLKVHPEAKNWHVRRIPKNAGLRKVLEILLDGLDDENFEGIREKIATVGNELKESEVADYLIVGMGHCVKKLYEDMEQQLDNIRKLGQRPDPDLAKRLKFLDRHARPDRLPVLLNDPFFNEFLKDPNGGCIYHIAKRLTGNTKAEEISRNEYKIRQEDLNFDINLQDLSINARNYVSQAAITTQTERLEEVTDLINEVINDACRETFYNFFQFNSESFQDLFASIRRHLHAQGKTLVLLIEDMAAISAIEDVLIDSLIEEGIKVGEEVLCPLKSAIAVTEGYIGYQKRGSTLATRAEFEWYLPNYSGDDERALTRIVNFCGRYLNAARIGEKRLRANYLPEKGLDNWPGIWCDKDGDAAETLQDFGSSDEGVPLFPYSKNAIAALASAYCKSHGELIFKPRTILQDILLNVLLYYRSDYENNKFPPKTFNKIECPGQLASELSTEALGDVNQLQSFAALWGWGANSLNELASSIAPGVARGFQLDMLAEYLENLIKGGKVTPKPIATLKIQNSPSAKSQPTVKPQQINPGWSLKVDEWFRNKSIPQDAAKLIRNVLAEEIDVYARNILKWRGVAEFLPLRINKQPMIYVHYNSNNPKGQLVAEFGGDKEFTKEDVRYKAVITAILRKTENGSWDYQEGYEDYCRFKNFISDWLSKQIDRVISAEREAISDALSKHGNLAILFEPKIASMPTSEKLSTLVQSVEVLQRGLTETGFPEWDNLVNSTLEQWRTNQENWLKWFTPALTGRPRRGIEGDLIFKGRGNFKLVLSRQIQQAVNETRKGLHVKYEKILDLLEGCSTKDQFLENINELKKVVEALKSEDQYKDMADKLSSRKLLNRIEKIEGTHWVSVKALLGLFEDKSNYNMIQLINTEHLDQLDKILDNWSALYSRNFMRIKAENLEAGVETRVQKQKEFTDMLEEYSSEFGIQKSAGNS